MQNESVKCLVDFIFKSVESFKSSYMCLTIVVRIQMTKIILFHN